MNLKVKKIKKYKTTIIPNRPLFSGPYPNSDYLGTRIVRVETKRTQLTQIIEKSWAMEKKEGEITRL